MSSLLENGYAKHEWEIRECTSNLALMQFLKKHHSELNAFEWIKVAQSQHFSVEIFKLYEKEIPWDNILLFRKVPVEYLEKHFGELDILECSAFQPLTAAFIEKHKDVLSLDILARRDDLEKEAREMAVSLYMKNDDANHHKRWDQNVMSSLSFCPKNFIGHYKDYQPPEEEVKEEPKNEDKPEEKKPKKKKVEKKEPEKKENKVKKPKKQKIIDYSVMKKAELKKILEKRKVRVYYHDTLEILIQKCKESEEKVC